MNFHYSLKEEKFGRGVAANMAVRQTRYGNCGAEFSDSLEDSSMNLSVFIGNLLFIDG